MNDKKTVSQLQYDLRLLEATLLRMSYIISDVANQPAMVDKQHEEVAEDVINTIEDQLFAARLSADRIDMATCFIECYLNDIRDTATAHSDGVMNANERSARPEQLKLELQ